MSDLNACLDATLVYVLNTTAIKYKSHHNFYDASVKIVLFTSLRTKDDTAFVAGSNKRCFSLSWHFTVLIVATSVAVQSLHQKIVCVLPEI